MAEGWPVMAFRGERVFFPPPLRGEERGAAQLPSQYTVQQMSP